MRHPAIFCIGALGALALASAAAAGGGHGHGGGGGLGGGLGGGFGASSHVGGLGSSVSRGDGLDRNDPSFGEPSRLNSEGSVHASATAKAHANGHSAIFDTATGVTRGPLAGLSTGMMVKDASGVPVGRVTKILRSDNGVVRVLVTSAGDPRHTIPLSPLGLSVSGGVATTTSTSIH
jgi:hypothetical protein